MVHYKSTILLPRQAHTGKVGLVLPSLHVQVLSLHGSADTESPTWRPFYTIILASELHQGLTLSKSNKVPLVFDKDIASSGTSLLHPPHSCYSSGLLFHLQHMHSLLCVWQLLEQGSRRWEEVSLKGKSSVLKAV